MSAFKVLLQVKGPLKGLFVIPYRILSKGSQCLEGRSGKTFNIESQIYLMPMCAALDRGASRLFLISVCLQDTLSALFEGSFP